MSARLSRPVDGDLVEQEALAMAVASQSQGRRFTGRVMVPGGRIVGSDMVRRLPSAPPLPVVPEERVDRRVVADPVDFAPPVRAQPSLASVCPASVGGVCGLREGEVSS